MNTPPGSVDDDSRSDSDAATTGRLLSRQKMFKYCVAIAIGIFLFVAMEPSSAQPSREYFDSDRSRTQKQMNARIRKQMETDCKAKAKKFYSAIHFQKRRAFVKDCIERSLVPLRRGLMG